MLEMDEDKERVFATIEFHSKQVKVYEFKQVLPKITNQVLIVLNTAVNNF